MIGEGPKSKTTGVPGWHTEAEEKFWMDQAKTVRDGIIVVVGCEYGRCVSEVTSIARENNTAVYAVDLFPSDHPRGDLLEIFKKNLREAGLLDNITIVVGDSAASGSQWDGPPIDLLIIDADHNYEPVKADIQAWLPAMHLDGMVIFHDYAKNNNSHYLHFEVKRAVDELLGSAVQYGPDSIAFAMVDEKLYMKFVKDDEPEEEDDLTEIKGIAETIADELAKIKIFTFNDLAHAKPADLVHIKTVSLKRAEQWIDEARARVAHGS